MERLTVLDTPLWASLVIASFASLKVCYSREGILRSSKEAKDPVGLDSRDTVKRGVALELSESEDMVARV